MNTKLGDLALNVIEFFGILIPGIVFTFLQADLLLDPFASVWQARTTVDDWFRTFIIGYIVGHMLLGLSIWLDWIAARIPDATTTAYFEAIKGHVTLPSALTSGPEDVRPVTKPAHDDVFYSAFTYIRLESATALAEIERQAAEYKLFRSLTFLFMLDLSLTILARPSSLSRMITDAILIVLCFYRFQFLHDWCRRLVFDFFLQLSRRDRPAALNAA